jgi:hypothetical protein
MKFQQFLLAILAVSFVGCNLKPEYQTDETEMAKEKRLVVVRNSLDSLVKLKEQNPQLDLSAVMPAVERLQADPNKRLSDKAREVYQQLKK